MTSLKTVSNYGFFAFPSAISLLVMQVYMPTFLADQTSMGFAVIGGLFFVARLIDGVSDPIIGYVSDKPPGKWASRYAQKYGRRRIWLLVFAPLFILTFWMLIEWNLGAAGTFTLICLWYVFGTCLMVPYYAWGAEIGAGAETGAGADDHNRFASARAVFGLAGTVAALVIPALILEQNDQYGFVQIGFGLALVSFIVALLLLLHVPERRLTQSVDFSFLEAFSLFKKGSNFNRLIISQLVNGVGNALPATLFVLFATHILQAPELTGILLLLYFLTAAMAVPLWSRLSRGWGKKYCWSGAMIAASCIFPLTIFVGPDTIWLFVLITIMTGVMAGADLTLPVSMLADVVEQDEFETGKPRSGAYFAIWGMVSKLMLALAIGVSFPLLDIEVGGGDLVSNAAITEGAGTPNTTMLVLLYAVVPSCLKIVSVLLIKNYHLPSSKDAVKKDTV